MESAGNTIKSPTSSLSSSSLSLSSMVVVVVSPCAACKILRRKCHNNCVFAPYFPPSEPLKFTAAHKVFGASNIMKFLKELPESQREDAVNSMVYEAKMRIRDPIYGCAGVISHLQKQVSELQEQLARTQAELLSTKRKNAQLTMICKDITTPRQSVPIQQYSVRKNADDIQVMNQGLLDEYIAFAPSQPWWT